MTAAQVNELIRISIPEYAKFSKFISRFREESDLLEFASNPLMLRTIIRHFDQPDGNPKFITNVLKACIWMAIREWDSMRGIRRYEREDESPLKNLSWLQRLAFHLTKSGKTDIRFSDLDAATKGFAGGKPKETVLSSIESQTGLVKQVEKDTWRFTHRAFLEYFAADFLVDSTSEISTIVSASLDRNEDTKILRYVCGLSSNASGVLSDLVERSSISSSTTSYSQLVEALTETYNVEENTLKKAIELFVYMASAKFDEAGAELASGTDSQDLTGDERSKVKPIWKISFSCKNQEPLSAVVRAVFRVRDSICSELLSHALQSSTDKRLVELRDLLSSEGILEDRKIVESGVTIVAFCVVAISR